MFRNILSAALVFVFTGVKAQMKQTQTVPKPLDSVRSSAKIKSAIGTQPILRHVDSVRFKTNISITKTSDKKVDSMTKFIKGKISTPKPQQAPANQPATQHAAKPGE
ncbi:MAG: hypothetical protein ABJA78_04250 [Ferruginibacter sp.]